MPVNSVNFDIAVVARDVDGDFLQIDIEKGESVSELINLTDQMGLDENNIAYNIEDEFLIFYKRAQTSKVWTRNTRENNFEIFENFFAPEINPTSVRTFAGKDFIITSYLDANFVDDRYLDVYNPANGNESTVFSINRDISDFDVVGSRLVMFYEDTNNERLLNAFDLSTPVLIAQFPVTSYQGYTFNDIGVHLFEEDHYRVYDFTAEVFSEANNTLEPITDSSLFRSNIRGNSMAYSFSYAQPSPLVDGPAIYDLNSGTNTLFQIFDLSAQLDAMGQSLLGGETFAINLLESVVIMGYSYIPKDTSETRQALAFVNLDMELLATLDVPFVPLDIIIK